MQEELVTIKTLKMLQEKGFNEYHYPTQSVVQKWLREVKSLHVEVCYMYGDYWIYNILTIPRHDLVGLSDRPLEHYKSYEEALEAGIQEALKLI